MTNTRPVPNLNAAIAQSSDGKLKVFLASPWMQFFQQFVQRAPAIVDVTNSGSPYQANQNGTVIVKGATDIKLIRGQTTIDLGAGQQIIPISIGDSIAWTGPATVQFLGS